jgi:uncharacterized protein YdcH (DUF465 family)
VILIGNLMLDMHEKLYREYPIFEEVYKIMDEELRTPYFDHYKELERKVQAAEQGKQAAEREVAELRRQLAAYQATQAATPTIARPLT